MSRTVFAIALTAGLVVGQVAPDTFAKIQAEAFGRTQVMDHLDHITNRIGPRLTSSDNLTIAMEWARDRLASYGLEARIEVWGTFPVGFNRGPWSGRIVTPAESARPLEFGTAAWSAGTKGRQKGRAVRGVDTPEAIAENLAQWKDAWVVQVGTSGGRRGGLPSNIQDAYRAGGALGVVTSSGDARIWTSGNSRIEFDALPTLPVISMAGPDHEALVALLEEGTAVELEFDIRNHFKKGPIPLYNCIAEIRGTEKPDEIVIVGGHLDSWDGAAGTTDNGTGASTTIEAARILAAVGAKPKRTIRFMLFSGEEQGLLGSRAFVQAHPEEMDRTSAVFVHDGGTNYASGLQATAPMVPIFERILGPLKALNPELPFEIVPVEGFSRMGASDHASWLQAGVPGFFWRQSGRANYGYGWHTQFDTYDLAVPEYQQHTAAVAAYTALAVANLDALLPRDGLLMGGEPGRQIGGRGAGGNSGEENRRMLGVQLEDGDGVIIASVEDGSPAARAGIQAKDRIVSIGTEKVTGVGDLRRALRAGGDKKVVTVERAGKQVELEVSFPSR